MISSQLFNSHSQRQYLYAGYTAIQSHTAIRNTPLISRDHSFLQQIFFYIPRASLPYSAVHRGKLSTYSN